VNEEQHIKIFKKPELQSSSLVVGWSEDAGQLGAKVMSYLTEKLGAEEFGEIEPADFFPLGGVSVENDIIRFPESKFYCCPEKSLVIFISNPPRAEWYRFLNVLLDVAESYCHANEVFTIGGMVFMGAHTVPRDLLALSNSQEIKSTLDQYNLVDNIDYESPPGHRPTLNSFLLWAAKRRGISSTEDPQSWRKILEFLDTRFDLTIDFGDIDTNIAKHSELITELRDRSPEVNNYINKLESNFGLTQEESEDLVREIEVFLKQA
jgi:proteasome assembly chaperone (PAC2) family protein